VYLDHWSILVFILKSGFKKVEWCWKREKSFMPIVVQMGACLDHGLDFLHVMLDVILIVFLVVFAVA
jgi:hypothetical protein